MTLQPTLAGKLNRAMITREQLKREIDAIDDAYLEVLHRIIFSLQQPPETVESPSNTQDSQAKVSPEAQHSPRDEEKTDQGETSLLNQLKQIKISGPVDFSENLDHYLNGEKNV